MNIINNNIQIIHNEYVYQKKYVFIHLFKSYQLVLQSPPSHPVVGETSRVKRVARHMAPVTGHMRPTAAY